MQIGRTDAAQIGAAFHKVGGKSVAQDMRRDLVGIQPRFYRHGLQQLVEPLARQKALSRARTEEIPFGMGAARSLGQKFRPHLQISGDGGARLTLLNPDHAAGERYIAVSVSDSGPGIARENLPRLTERFYRVEGQKSGERAGTGLGLAIVKHIMNRHKGGLAVESAPGEGTTFTAYFPAFRSDAATG